MAGLTERFMQAVQTFEDRGEVEPLLGFFAEDGEALNLGRTEPARGLDEVRAFWLDYRAVFRRVRSEFTNVIEGPGGAVLEWVSRGALASGEPVEYRGVSVLETDGHLVRRFRTYYDSAVFLPGRATQDS
jgi:ketosteroid isomerase-like protein